MHIIFEDNYDELENYNLLSITKRPIHKILCRVNFTNSRKNDFLTLRIGRNIECLLYTLQVAALIIANFNFASEAKR